MPTLRDFMQVCDYRITEGSDYTWQCFGPHAYRLDSWNGDQDGHTVTVVFDTRSQEVYQMEAFDYARNRAYRWTNPLYRAAHDQAAEDLGTRAKEAWDDVDFTDLEVEEDFLDKAQAIVQGQDYDTRIQVPVDFTDQELLTYMKLAHEQDLTFNQFVEQALRGFIREQSAVS